MSSYHSVLYDPFTNVWSTDQLSAGRRYLAATTLGNAAYFVGGESTVAVRSSAADVFTLRAPVPEPSALSLLAIGGIGMLRRRRLTPA